MHRLLLVRLGALGDVVHAIPAAAALRRRYPAANIHWLVSAKHAEILSLVPSIDRVIAVADRSGVRGGLSPLAALRELRRVRYDCAVDLQGLLKSAAFARGSGAARVVGFARGYLREPAARFCYTDTHDPGGSGLFDRDDRRHVIAFNLDLLRALDVPPAPPEFPLAPVVSDTAADVAERAGGAYVLLNPGAAWPNKRWPPERFGLLAAEIRRVHGLQSAVIWGPNERELADEVAAHAGGAAFVCGRTAVRDLVALARGARVMVSGDTGPTHIAAAVGTPIVGLYGPTRPERNGPWRKADEVVSRAASCECHHLRRCRRERMCLFDISVDDVAAAVDRRLASERAHA